MPLDVNTQIFLVSTIIVPIVFAIIFLWGIRSGQFRGDTESIKYKPLKNAEEEDDDG